MRTSSSNHARAFHLQRLCKRNAFSMQPKDIRQFPMKANTSLCIFINVCYLYLFDSTLCRKNIRALSSPSFLGMNVAKTSLLPILAWKDNWNCGFLFWYSLCSFRNKRPVGLVCSTQSILCTLSDSQEFEKLLICCLLFTLYSTRLHANNTTITHIASSTG